MRNEWPLDRGRELMRQTLEAVINDQAPDLEKKELVAEPAPDAKDGANTKDKQPKA